jgi:hypothetical protein
VESGTADGLISPERLQAIAAAIPIKRLARPTDVAKTVAFLASEGSGVTSGHYIPVSGEWRPGITKAINPFPSVVDPEGRSTLYALRVTPSGFAGAHRCYVKNVSDPIHE